MPSSRFFVFYNNGSCHRQFIEKNKLCEIPKIIASYLNLDTPELYTGQCFRRIAATTLPYAGANMISYDGKTTWRLALRCNCARVH